MTAVLHGYTLADLDWIARGACARDRSMSSDVHGRFDLAWSAIAEHLCVTAARPTPQELLGVGMGAIYQDVREMKRCFGISRDNGTELLSGAVRYGYMPGADPEDDRVERWAVPQIFAALRPRDRETLTVLAVHGDYHLAADALGLQRPAYMYRVRVARTAFREYWYSPDTAPRVPRIQMRPSRPRSMKCGRGHDMDPESSHRHCRECARDRDTARHAALASQATCAVCGAGLSRTQRQRGAGYCPDCQQHRLRPQFEPPDRVRAHIAALRGAGMVLREITEQCGVPMGTLSTISRRRVRVAAEMADRICAVPIPSEAEEGAA